MISESMEFVDVEELSYFFDIKCSCLYSFSSLFFHHPTTLNRIHCGGRMIVIGLPTVFFSNKITYEGCVMAVVFLTSYA